MEAAEAESEPGTSPRLRVVFEVSERSKSEDFSEMPFGMEEENLLNFRGHTIEASHQQVSHEELRGTTRNTFLSPRDCMAID
eukprot:scaffold72461_cov103-Cyclotella_meneghiniana.AAC.1